MANRKKVMANSRPVRALRASRRKHTATSRKSSRAGQTFPKYTQLPLPFDLTTLCRFLLSYVPPRCLALGASFALGVAFQYQMRWLT